MDGYPCWSHDGLICVANAHKDKVKLTFFQGASLLDPNKLFNAGLEGNRWRAIDLYEGDKINERSLKSLIRSAFAHNLAKKSTESSRLKVKPIPELESVSPQFFLISSNLFSPFSK